MKMLDKLNAMFEIAGIKKLESKEAMMLFATFFADPANLKFRHTSQLNSTQMLLPEYSKIIAQGMQEGLFDTISAEGAAELLVALNMGLSDRFLTLFLDAISHPALLEEIESKIHCYEFAMERVLGLPPDSLHVFNRNIFESFLDVKEVTS